MDKYEAIVEQYRSECEFSIPMTSSERLAHFARWYEDKYLQEALTAAAMMKLHEEKTCEFPSHIAYHNSWWEYCPVCGRRIKEAK
jgi:hypothetical protein